MKVICAILALVAAAQAGFINGGHGIGHEIGVGHGVGVVPAVYSGGFGYGGLGYSGLAYSGLGYSGLGYGLHGVHGAHGVHGVHGVHSAYHVAPVHHSYAVPAIAYASPVHYGVGHTKVIDVGHGVHGYNAGWLKKK